MKRFCSLVSVSGISTRLIIASTLVILIAAGIFVSGLAEEEKRAAVTETQQEGQVAMEAESTIIRSSEPKKEEDVSPEAIDLSRTDSVELITPATYAFTSGTDTLESISSGTTQLIGPNSDDGNPITLQNIGFDFWYDGVCFTQFGVNANGLLRLGNLITTGSFDNATGFAATTNAPKIAPFYDDLCTGTTGQVHFKVVGTAPNRKLVVEYQNMQITRNKACGGVGGGTFQLWLYEPTHSTLPGGIEFVYGSGMVATAAVDGGYSVGLQSGAATNIASVTTSGPTVSYATANNTQTTAITAGTKYTFTPAVPSAPAGLNFTAITKTEMQLNWTDTSTDEAGFVIYRSTDGVNYTFRTQTAAGALLFVDSGLLAGTTYFYQVHAFSAGAFSTPVLAGSQATTAAGTKVSTVSGNWSDIATWGGAPIPLATDNVTIADGTTVTIDVAAAVCNNLTVGQGGSGILQYQVATVRTLTVSGNVTVATGGTFSAGIGVLAHVLNIGGSAAASTAAGNLTVNGIFDMNTTATVTTNFFGGSDGTVSGAGATCDFFAIVTNKGSSQAPILDVTRVITIAAPTASANRLNTLNGTFRLSSASTLTPWFGSQTLIAATGRLWINDAGASVTAVGVGTGTGAGTPTITGTLRVDAGTWGYGSGNNEMLFTDPTGTLIIGGASATVNMFGRATFDNNSTFTMTAGSFNLDPQATNNLGVINNIVGFLGPNTVAFTGGTLTIIDPHAGSGTGRAFNIDSDTTATYNFAGGTIRFGNGLSAAAGSADGFDIDTFDGGVFVPIGSVIADNTATNAATRFVRANCSTAELNINGDLTLTAAGGSRFNFNGHLVRFGEDIINNGIIDGSTTGSRLYWLGNGVASNYSGTGTSVVPLLSWEVDNALGVSISAVTNVVVRRINLFAGDLTGANELTLGNNDATVSVVQIGNSTTPTAAGNLDVAPTFNLGTGGQTISYLRTTTVNRATGPEINPGRSLVSMTFDDNGASHTLDITGGDLTVSGWAGSLLLTNGIIQTGTNVLIVPSSSATALTRTNGHVDGFLRKTYSSAVTRTFEVGTANSYSPMTAVVTAGTFPSTLTVSAVQGPHPSVTAATSLQRYWSVTEGGTLTATMTFTYGTDVLDVMGTETLYRVIKVEGGTATNFPEVCPAGPCVNQGSNNFVSPVGVTSFSDWTAGEPFAPTSATAHVGGRVLNNVGAPLAGVTMTLLDTVLLENRTTVTNANGDYFFDAILTGRQILVTPARNGYTFDPSTRAFDHSGDRMNVDFTGTPASNLDSVGSDFDGDGKADLSVFRPSDATWYTLLSSTGVLKAEQWGLGTDRIAPADYDGDHITDVAVFRPSDGGWYIKQSSTSTLRAVNWGLADDVVTPADFDGDGQADIAVWRPSNGTWYVIQSTNGQTRTVQWGTNGDRPVAADYDGDGKADMAVWRPSNGTWYVLKSTDGSFQYEHWGIEEDRPVVGDYDGDTKSDLAVFRPSTSTWYVKLSSDASTYARGHGTAMDILTPGDYDGDGKTDVAVWQLGGDWNILRSTTNTPFGQTWGMTGDIPTTSAYVR